MAVGVQENKLMKIIRCEDRKGNIVHAVQSPDGSALKLAGDIYGSLQPTPEKVEIKKLLAPIQPSSIICIGLNYRKHAEETGAKFPEYPVVFFKGINTLQHPGGPIWRCWCASIWGRTFCCKCSHNPVGPIISPPTARSWPVGTIARRPKGERVCR